MVDRNALPTGPPVLDLIQHVRPGPEPDPSKSSFPAATRRKMCNATVHILRECFLSKGESTQQSRLELFREISDELMMPFTHAFSILENSFQK